MRIHIIDNLRGIAFILMVIQHAVIFYDEAHNTNYHNIDIIELAGFIARNIFIILAGYSVNLSHKKKDKNILRKRIKRSIEIFLHALIINITTYLLYPDQYVRFGILHFISIGTLLISFIAPYKILTLIIFIASLLYKFPNVNPFINTITGSQVEYHMMDWFPLQKWLPVMLSGLIIGQYVNIDKLKIPLLEKASHLSLLSKNSLELYTLHFVIFALIAKL
jgi:uncharacterized membrane protein